MTVESGARIRAFSHLEGCHVSRGSVVGPFARLRPGAELAEDVHVGNFVEVKNSILGPGVKADHLSYIGDADVGSDVNFGCGSVVVNYDGYVKSRSTVGDGAFIGCNVNLISPVEIQARAFLAAGSTISRDVAEDALAVARARQRNIDGWVARKEGRPHAAQADPEKEESNASADRDPGGQEERD